MSSTVVRAITRDGSVCVIASDSTEIVAKARNIHQTSKTTTALLGRCLTAASLMGAQLKSPDNSLTFQINCDGPAEGVVCVSDYHGNVRGYVEQPNVELPPNKLGKLDVGGAVGNGSLNIVKDLGMNEPYVGVCPLVSGEIAEDVTQYFQQSEQIPSACALGVRVNKDLSVKSAGGFLVQLLPGADDAVVDVIEKNLSKISSVSKMIADGQSADDIIGILFEGLEYDILDRSECDYKCTCSRERYARVLKSLGKEELQNLINENKPIETVCSFCNSKYVFSIEDAKKIFDQIK